MRMMTKFIVFFIVAACLAEEACKSVDWKARALLVKPGMTRAEVEKILPPYSGLERPGSKLGCGALTIGQGGSQGVIYWVDAEWRVSVCYDYTGIARDANGKVSYSSPDNRVIGGVSVTNEPCPLVRELKIETSNHPVEPTRAPEGARGSP